MINMVLKFNKKAQSATEYLHTYGWVFLSAMMVAGVLIYHNFQSSKSIVPSECSFLSGINCIDEHVDETVLSLALINEFGFPLSNITLNVSGSCNSTANTSDGNPYSNPNTLLVNQQANYFFDCQNLSNTKVEEVVSMGYVDVKTGIQHVKVGKLFYSPGES